jgi:NADPH2:quinone reductase
VTNTYLYSLYVTASGTLVGDVYWDTVVNFLFVILIGRYLESISKRKAVASTQRLLDLQPKVATVLRDGEEALMPIRGVKPGETVLVLGAAGGVGTAAIQIAKAMGAKVIAAASTDEKCALCTTLGADATINYSTQNLRESLKTLTEGKGPDVVYDPVGGDLAEPAFRSIAWRGRYLVVGFAGGPIPSLPLNLPLLKGASLVGVFWGDFSRREPQANAAMMGELAQWYGQGKIKPVLDRTLPMSELKAAYTLMGSRSVKGKLVMVN